MAGEAGASYVRFEIMEGMLVLFAFIALLLLILLGYVANIVKLFSAPMDGRALLRGIGIFVFPLGIVMGFL